MNNKIFETVPHANSYDPLVSDREEQGKVKKKVKYLQRNIKKKSKWEFVHGLLIKSPCSSQGIIVHVHLIINPCIKECVGPNLCKGK